MAVEKHFVIKMSRSLDNFQKALYYYYFSYSFWSHPVAHIHNSKEFIH